MHFLFVLGPVSEAGLGVSAEAVGGRGERAEGFFHPHRRGAVCSGAARSPAAEDEQLCPGPEPPASLGVSRNQQVLRHDF